MSTKQQTSTTMNIALWIAQGLLAATFIWAGFMKIFKPNDLPFLWVKDKPQLAFFTGIIDLLAGLGIVLPAITGIKTKLTIFTAWGIVILMIAACIFHISRNEAKDIGFNIFMLLIAGFVALGRGRSNDTFHR